MFFFFFFLKFYKKNGDFSKYIFSFFLAFIFQGGKIYWNFLFVSVYNLYCMSCLYNNKMKTKFFL